MAYQTITNEIFSKRIQNIISETTENQHPNKKLKSRYGSESVNYKASQLWQNVRMKIKYSGSLEIFKLIIKSWTAD